MRYVLLYIAVLIQLNLCAQLNYAPISIAKDKIKLHADSTRIHFKTKLYTNALLGALEHYPELKRLRIKVVSKKMNMLMRVRPSIISSFRKPAKRKYKIFINSTNTNGIPIPDDFTFNAQVGVFAHELSHICDYLNMSLGKLFYTARHYKKPAFKKEMERKTDLMTLEHGMGWQLYDYAVQWSKLGEKFSKYIKTKNEFYLNSSEMMGLMMDLGYN